MVEYFSCKKVEVNQIGERKYFIKLVVAHKRGGFVRLLEAIDSLKLQVVSINLTTLNGRVQNILEIKVRFQEKIFFYA